MILGAVGDEIDLGGVAIVPGDWFVTGDHKVGGRLDGDVGAIVGGEADEVFAGFHRFEAGGGSWRSDPGFTIEGWHEGFAFSGIDDFFSAFGLKRDGLASGLDANGVIFHADEFRFHGNGGGLGRAVGSHGDGADHEFLGGAEDIFAGRFDAEIEVSGIAKKLSGFRDGLLILIGDFDRETATEPSAGGLWEHWFDGE